MIISLESNLTNVIGYLQQVRQRKGELLGNLGYSNMSNVLLMFLKFVLFLGI